MASYQKYTELVRESDRLHSFSTTCNLNHELLLLMDQLTKEQSFILLENLCFKDVRNGFDDNWKPFQHVLPLLRDGGNRQLGRTDHGMPLFDLSASKYGQVRVTSSL